MKMNVAFIQPDKQEATVVFKDGVNVTAKEAARKSLKYMEENKEEVMDTIAAAIGVPRNILN